MSTVEVLKQARALIDTPEKWSSRGWGGGDRYRDGQRCAVHALHSAGGWSSFNDRPGKCTVDTSHYRALQRAVGNAPISGFNDSHTHAEVLAAFDRAIANEEAKAQEFTVDVLDAVEAVLA